MEVKVWAPDFFSYLAQEKGFFDLNKVKVELTLVEDYEQILNGDLIYENSNGVHSRVVYAIDFSNTGDVIIRNVNSSSNSNTTLVDVNGINSLLRYWYVGRKRPLRGHKWGERRNVKPLSVGL